MRLLGMLYLGGSLLGAPVLAQTADPVAASAKLHARYVVLGMAGEASVAYARAIIDPGLSCPAVTANGASKAMVSRDNPHAFPVVVCEALVPFDQALGLQLADASLSLPTVRPNPTRIQVFGDTGCKSKDCPPGTPAKPFATLAAAAASAPADLILHMGDYNYRGTPSSVMFTESASGDPAQAAHWTYDAGDGSKLGDGCGQNPGTRYYSQNQANSNFTDNWPSWRDDFFVPAGDLLASAPWVLARGNHELCSRAGPGWFYFLDPASKLTGGQRACPDAEQNARPIHNVVLSKPYAVDLGTLTVLVLDTANACDSFVNPIFQPKFDAQLADLADLAPTSGSAWLMHHRPLWAVTKNYGDGSTACDSAKKYGCINQTLQTALNNGLNGSLPPAVELVLSGHMHRFQSVTFTDGARPAQIVIGNSGVELDSSPPQGSHEVTVDRVSAEVLTTRDVVRYKKKKTIPAFAYLDVSFGADGEWHGKLIDDAPGAGIDLAKCGTRTRRKSGSICELAKGVKAK